MSSTTSPMATSPDANTQGQTTTTNSSLQSPEFRPSPQSSVTPSLTTHWTLQPPELLPPASIHTPSPEARTSSHGTPLFSDETSTTVTYTPQDMALLHHWTRHASQTIVCAPSADELWQDIFPRIGLEHAFVMSAILSLSALHMAYHDKAQRQYLLNEAARHNNDAVRGLRQQLNHLHESMSDALFACASLNVVYIFASAGPLSDSSNQNGSSSLQNQRILGTDWIPLMRGVGVVVEAVHQEVRKGPLAPLLEIGNWFELDPEQALAPGDAELQRLSNIWAEDSSGKDVYDETLASLRRCNAFIHHPHNFVTSPTTPNTPEEQRKWGYNGPWAGPMIWIQFLSEDFLSRLYQRQPYALVLFAHFGALMHTLDRVWCFEGWGRRIVSVVGEILGSYWDGWLSWCRSVVER